MIDILVSLTTGMTLCHSLLARTTHCGRELTIPPNTLILRIGDPKAATTPIVVGVINVELLLASLSHRVLLQVVLEGDKYFLHSVRFHANDRFNLFL